MKQLSRGARLERRKRLGRISYGISGSVFLIGAWDGFSSTPPASNLLIWTSILFGVVQLGALLWSRAGDPPERLANSLAALGMFVSAYAAMHHRSGIQYAYIFAGGLYSTLAIFGIEKIGRFIKRRPLLDGSVDSLEG